MITNFVTFLYLKKQIFSVNFQQSIKFSRMSWLLNSTEGSKTLKINELKNRFLQIDTNLHAVMRIFTSKLTPNFKNIVKNCEQLVMSH